MDIQQLKLLAARIRGLLQQSQCSIGHNPSLDIAASLAGLRSWPEVLAFPDRIAACQLDTIATTRLAFRLKRKFGLEFTSEQLLEALAPDARAQAQLPQIWPTGAAPGVYLTTEKDAITALIAAYEESTDGALIYAEDAGGHAEGSIYLGDNGLWSRGLDRAPSGTLIIVGPLKLDQSYWDDSSRHLQMACIVARAYGHRVAVLLHTPTPERICEDAHLMVRSLEDCDEEEEALIGMVSDSGELVVRTPFIHPQNTALTTPRVQRPTADAIPAPARSVLESTLRDRRAGVVMLGTAEIGEHAAIELIQSALALTEHAGPVARIMPRTRSTPSKFWDVPPAIVELPFLPSIQSAYDQGFRRMMVYGNYTEGDVMLDHKDVLFIASGWGSTVQNVFMNATRMYRREELELLESVIAILAVTLIPARKSTLTVTDLYVHEDGLNIPKGRYEEVMAFIESHRAIKWEADAERLLQTGQVNARQLRKAFGGDRHQPEGLDKLLKVVKTNYDSAVERSLPAMQTEDARVEGDVHG